MTDLTAITTPFGLLDRETQEALKAHGGPYEIYQLAGHWDDAYPAWSAGAVYRVKPTPREAWSVGHVMKETRAEADLFLAQLRDEHPDIFADTHVTRWVEVLE